MKESTKEAAITIVGVTIVALFFTPAFPGLIPYIAWAHGFIIALILSN